MLVCIFCSLSLLGVPGCISAKQKVSSKPLSSDERPPLALSSGAGSASLTSNHGNTVLPEVKIVRLPFQDGALVTLWIDAGSRDAVSPEVAVVTAMLAAQKADLASQYWVTPDATEFYCRVQGSALEACFSKIAKALAFKEAHLDEIDHALHRLILQQGQESADDLTSVDELALESVLGDSASKFFPLSLSHRDGLSMDPVKLQNQVHAFLGAHYGKNRARVIVGLPATLGPTSLEDSSETGNSLRIGEMARKHFSPLAQSSKARALPSPFVVSSNLQSRVLAKVGKSREAVMWAVFDSEDRLRNVAMLLADPVFSGQAIRFVDPVFLRGLNLLRVQVETSFQFQAHVEQALFAIRWAENEARMLGKSSSQASSKSPFQEGPQIDLHAEIRKQGLAWSRGQVWRRASKSQADSTQKNLAKHSMKLGLGLMLTEGRKANPCFVKEGNSCFKGILKKTQQSFLKSNQIQPASQIPSSGLWSLKNGVTTRFIYQKNSPFGGFAFRFKGGASEENAANHGTTAWLAHHLVTSCEGISSADFRKRQRELGLKVFPMVEPDSWGAVFIAPRQHVRQAFHVASHCMSRPSHSEADAEISRNKLMNKLVRKDSSLEFLAQTARVVSPAFPGRVAPYGEKKTLQGLSSESLFRFFEKLQSNRLAVSFFADAPLSEFSALISNRLSYFSVSAGFSERAGFEKPISLPVQGEQIVEQWRKDFFQIFVSWPIPKELKHDAWPTHPIIPALKNRFSKVGGLVPVWGDVVQVQQQLWAVVAFESPTFDFKSFKMVVNKVWQEVVSEIQLGADPVSSLIPPLSPEKHAPLVQAVWDAAGERKMPMNLGSKSDSNFSFSGPPRNSRAPQSSKKQEEPYPRFLIFRPTPGR